MRHDPHVAGRKGTPCHIIVCSNRKHFYYYSYYSVQPQDSVTIVIVIILCADRKKAWQHFVDSGRSRSAYQIVV